MLNSDDWSFNNNISNSIGPNKWDGNCKLKHQSPINIDTDFVKKCSIQCTLSISYTKSSYKITNWKGKMLKINVDKGNNIFWNDQKYQLRSIDIHWPSMHTINGNKYQMELNFLHISELGRKVYFSVFLNVNDIQSEEASILDEFSKIAPGKGTKIDTSKNYNLLSLIPDSKTFFVYTGSVPFPPCHEEVDWIIFENPINISSSSYKRFKSLKMLKYNTRPLQPLHNRIVFYNNDLLMSGKKIQKKKTIIQCRKASRPRNYCNNPYQSERHTLNTDSGGTVNNSFWKTFWLIFKWILLIILILIILKICFSILNLLWIDGVLARFDMKLIIASQQVALQFKKFFTANKIGKYYLK